MDQNNNQDNFIDISEIQRVPHIEDYDPNKNYVNSLVFKDSQGNGHLAELRSTSDNFFFQSVPEYKDFFGVRKNYYFPEFGFDINTFENLCDDYCPEEDFPIILNCSIQQLDRFCALVYKQDFHTTYTRLYNISKQIMRRAYKNLAKSGNATAINTQNAYVKFDDNNNSNQPIQIVLDINKINNTEQ